MARLLDAVLAFRIEGGDEVVRSYESRPGVRVICEDATHAASTVNAPNRWVGWANEASDSEALRLRLRAEGFGFVLTVPRELERLLPALGTLTERGAANLDDLLGLLASAHQTPRCGVFSL